jgi:hypothetical protein
MIKVTVCLTSCGRFDLLRQTVDSFERLNTHPIAERLIYEDSGQPIPDGLLPEGWRVVGNEKIGQYAAIDRLYAEVKTPYIFHLEDDWDFYRSGFIEASMPFLEDPKCVTVWLRERNDTNGHPVEGDRLILNHAKRWHGFTLNPGLRRLKDYHAVAPFGGRDEASIGLIYKERGYYAAITPQGYVRHTGCKRSVYKRQWSS